MKADGRRIGFAEGTTSISAVCQQPVDAKGHLREDWPKTAGLRESESDHQYHLNEADKLLDTLEFLTEEERADAIEVPCPKCVVCEEAANRYCYNCGRKLKST